MEKSDAESIKPKHLQSQSNSEGVDGGKQEGKKLSGAWAVPYMASSQIIKLCLNMKNECLLLPLGFASARACHCCCSWHCLSAAEWSWCNSHLRPHCTRRANKCCENTPAFVSMFLLQALEKSSQVYLLVITAGISYFRNINSGKWMSVLSVC